MKLISYLNESEVDQLAILVDDKLYNTQLLDSSLESNMGDFLWDGKNAMDKAIKLNEEIKVGNVDQSLAKDLSSVELLSPVPFPTSTRDAYAFRQHVAAARKNRGVEMIPEFDQFPVFYFTNHNAVQGPGEVILMPDHFQKLDFELEVAIVIGKEGRNIPASEADNHIAGFMVMNDLSARALQMEEMRLNLGPAKGKDFINIFGPWMVTVDELQEKVVPCKDGHTGNNYDLGMKTWVNGEIVSEGNVATMDWTFAEIIERASYGVDLLPGDVIGSGTVGTGCFLELNGTGKRLDPNYEPQWLNAGDVVKMEIAGMGKLSNTILLEDTPYSLLSLKK